MPPDPVTNFEIQKCYQNEPKFNGIYSRNNLSKVKDGTYLISLHKCESVGPHWITLCANAKHLTYFDSFGVEHITKEIKKFIGNKNVITDIYRK